MASKFSPHKYPMSLLVGSPVRQQEKKKWWQHPSPKPVETASSSALPQLTRESQRVNFSLRFLESDASQPSLPGRFRVVLLQEGMGNFGDCHFYTHEALESAVKLFEGAQAYANHPSRSEQEDRPERDVRDVIGHFESVHVERVGGRSELRGDLVTMKGDSYNWVRDQINSAIEYKSKYPDKDLVGLSINAMGDAERVSIKEFQESYKIPKACIPKIEEALQNGIEFINVVRVLDGAISCDLVTTAGAGGKILNAIS